MTDRFSFNADKIVISAAKKGDTITKRQLFSLGLKIYDPLGLIAPVTLPAKLAMQQIWLDPTKWDQKVNEQRFPLWKKYWKGLDNLQEVLIDRYTGIDENQPSELHLFCDVSEDAYGKATSEDASSRL